MGVIVRPCAPFPSVASAPASRSQHGPHDAGACCSPPYSCATAARADHIFRASTVCDRRDGYGMFLMAFQQFLRPPESELISLCILGGHFQLTVRKGRMDALQVKSSQGLPVTNPDEVRSTYANSVGTSATGNDVRLIFTELGANPTGPEPEHILKALVVVPISMARQMIGLLETVLDQSDAIQQLQSPKE